LSDVVFKQATNLNIVVFTINNRLISEILPIPSETRLSFTCSHLSDGLFQAAVFPAKNFVFFCNQMRKRVPLVGEELDQYERQRAARKAQEVKMYVAMVCCDPPFLATVLLSLPASVHRNVAGNNVCVACEQCWIERWPSPVLMSFCQGCGAGAGARNF